MKSDQSCNYDFWELKLIRTCIIGPCRFVSVRFAEVLVLSLQSPGLGSDLGLCAGFKPLGLFCIGCCLRPKAIAVCDLRCSLFLLSLFFSPTLPAPFDFSEKLRYMSKCPFIHWRINKKGIVSMLNTWRNSGCCVWKCTLSLYNFYMFYTCLCWLFWWLIYVYYN